MLLENLTLFLRIVEKGGMAAAGRELGLSPASVSERVAGLESYYGARLLTRTTRSISLTDEGRDLVTGARRILAEAQDVEARIKVGVEKISGFIHLSAPVDLGRNRIAAILDGFVDDHPEISIDFTLSDGYLDLVRQGVDLALRYGDLADSTLRSRKLASNRRIVCASPDYLRLHGTPHHPKDLHRHNCMLMRFGDQIDSEWRFMVDGKVKACAVKGNRISNDGNLVREWCLSGFGLSLKSEWDVHEDLRKGTLVAVLTDYAPAPNSLQLVYPAGIAQPRRVRLLMERIVQIFPARDS